MSKVLKFALPFGAGASLLGKVLSGPKPPEVKPPLAPPTPNDEEVRKAKLRSLQAQQARTGRQSTILSDSTGSDTLG